MKFARALEEESPGILRGIKLLSKVDLGHAEERLHNLIRRWGLTIPVYPYTMCSKTMIAEKILLQQPMVLISTWFNYLLTAHPQLLLGGYPRKHEHTDMMLTSFWDAYRHEHPDHEVFVAHAGHLDKCIPYTIFHDEGRGLKKSPVQIVAMEAVFGKCSYDDLKKELKAGKPLSGDLCLKTLAHTGKGPTLFSRFLLYALPHHLYRGKKRKSFWNRCFDCIPPDCRKIFNNGCLCEGDMYYGICVGLKGDAPAQAKAGSLNRTFSHLGYLKGICSQCLAGTGHDCKSPSKPLLPLNPTLLASKDP